MARSWLPWPLIRKATLPGRRPATACRGEWAAWGAPVLAFAGALPPAKASSWRSRSARSLARQTRRCWKGVRCWLALAQRSARARVGRWRSSSK